jgi:hypothetical protein
LRRIFQGDSRVVSSCRSVVIATDPLAIGVVDYQCRINAR